MLGSWLMRLVAVDEGRTILFDERWIGISSRVYITDDVSPISAVGERSMQFFRGEAAVMTGRVNVVECVLMVPIVQTLAGS